MDFTLYVSKTFGFRFDDIKFGVFQSQRQGEIQEEISCIMVKSHFHSPLFQPNVQRNKKLCNFTIGLATMQSCLIIHY